MGLDIVVNKLFQNNTTNRELSRGVNGTHGVKN
jgi:hypothetical protein